jgi:hypothetical protein
MTQNKFATVDDIKKTQLKPQRRMLFKPRLKNDADASREADDDLDYPPKADGNTANTQAE